MNDEMLTIIITIMMVALSSIYLYINRQKTRSPLGSPLRLRRGSSHAILRYNFKN
jgi:hypothetical protein